MILFKDGVNYIKYQYKDELEIEDMIFRHHEYIFGKNSLLLAKRKIKTNSGIGTIPDAFVISLDDKKWYLIEVELKNHPLYEHIVPQISKFNTAIKNSDSQKKLIKMIYEEIKDDPRKNLMFQLKNIKEVYKYIAETLESKPQIIILIDGKSNELEEVCDSLPFDSKVIEFKTFCRENVGIGDHIHSFEPLKDFIKVPSVSKDGLGTLEIIPEIDIPEKINDSVEIRINKIHSPRKYGLINLTKQIRGFFPGYKEKFILDTDIGEIVTKVTSASRIGVQIGDPVEGAYIQGGLKPWYEKHRELKEGDKLIITVIEPKKKYKLNIVK